MDSRTNQVAEPLSLGTSMPAQVRLASLDAYRGLVMFLMMAEVLSLSHVSRALPESGWWRFLAFHQSHVEWIGCSLHDMIQPSFSFLVGAALPFSIANRLARGQARTTMTLHAIWRALILVLLGVFLRSIGRPQTYWTFEDTLSQIGMGYVFLFLLGFAKVRTQWIAFGLILFGYWLAFALYPVPGADFDYSKVGVAKDWPHLMNGFAAHWNKNSNLAWAFDCWFLNLFPRESRFLFNGGGYATLSFIPTLGTMLLGLFAGEVIRSERKPWDKIKWFVVAGCTGLLLGAGLSYLHVCPSVKRIWTPSWVLFSGGWCFLFLAAFYLLLDVWNRKGWAFPLVVIGMNSIAAYCIAHLFEHFVRTALVTHLGVGAMNRLGGAYSSLVEGTLTLLVFWLILFWMYRRRIFLRI
jgi:heparan-alpha-glucosaminide N-acetyltransferase